MIARPLECSVCIANYNGASVIEACIESVLVQAGDFAIEIIVHDDASTDGSATLIRQRFPQVLLIESDTNVGFCVANNRMADRAKGRYLLLLNNDATLYPDALMVLRDEAKRLGETAVLTLPQYDAATDALLDIGCLLDPFLNPIPNLSAQCGDVGTVAGACLWVDADLWRELGGFPEWFGSIGEDLYLCCRARLAGHPVRALGVSGYRHCVGSSFGGGKVRDGRLFSTIRRRALSERNKTYVMAMTYPGPIMQLLLPIHLLLLMVEGGLLALLARRADLLSRIYWPVLVALVIERRRLVDSRREAMATCRVGACRFFATTKWWPHKLRLLWLFGTPRLR